MNNETVFPLPLWFVLIVTLLFGCPNSASAEPLFRFTAPEGVVITLHSDRCELKEVSNLPQRATWDENGKTFEGCWRPSAFFPLFIFFFQGDKTIADVPAGAFKKVIGV